ncbi:MAG: amino acid adenylation domain-containing protein [Lautropia sp.]
MNLQDDSRDPPRPATTGDDLIEMVLARARATPHAVAIVWDGGTVDYAALVTRAAQVCAGLLAHGVAPQTPVGILMQRTPDLVAAMLGILAAGACYVPLEPADPTRRNRRILQNAGVERVLTDRTGLATLAGPITEDWADGTPAVFVDVDDLAAASPRDRAAPQPDIRSPDVASDRRLAYILHTSGSTGLPKGVEVERRSVVNLLRTVRDLIGFGPADRMLAAATVAFDISVAEIFLPLISGGSLLLRDRNVWLDPRRLAEDLRAFDVSVVQSGPSTWAMLRDELPTMPRPRVLISTGEAIPADLADVLSGCADQAWNLYGPTETTVWATAHRLTGAETARGLGAGASASIGHPLAGVTTHVLADDGGVVAGDAPGELWIGGVALARGYRGDAQATASRFVEHRRFGRLYRTGDLVQRGPDGELRYLGRLDDQIKIRGFRIEPGEVEAALLACPGVRGAAVTWCDSPTGHRRLVAGIVASPDTPLDAARLGRWIGARLPAAFVPSTFIALDALPRSTSGKIDRAAIRAAIAARSDVGTEPDDRHAATTTPADASPGASPGASPDVMPDARPDATLARHWREVLGRSRIDADEHFFLVGGDSLSAVRLVSGLNRELGLALTVQDIFDAPRLTELAARVARHRRDARPGPGPGPARTPR